MLVSLLFCLRRNVTLGLVLGTFDIGAKIETDMISISNFNISSGVMAVIEKTLFAINIEYR